MHEQTNGMEGETYGEYYTKCGGGGGGSLNPKRQTDSNSTVDPGNKPILY